MFEYWYIERGLLLVDEQKELMGKRLLSSTKMAPMT